MVGLLIEQRDLCWEDGIITTVQQLLRRASSHLVEGRAGSAVPLNALPDGGLDGHIA